MIYRLRTRTSVRVSGDFDNIVRNMDNIRKSRIIWLWIDMEHGQRLLRVLKGMNGKIIKRPLRLSDFELVEERRG